MRLYYHKTRIDAKTTYDAIELSLYVSMERVMLMESFLSDIIQSHQQDIDDNSELSEFRRKEKIKKYEQVGRETPNYLYREIKKTELRYWILEDTANKQWLIYDSANEQTKLLPFGEYVTFILNGFLVMQKDHIHYEKYCSALEKAGMSMQDYDDTAKHVSEYADELQKLSDILSGYVQCTKNFSKNQLESYIYQIWIRYRYCFQDKIWGEYISERNRTTCDYRVSNNPVRVNKAVDLAHRNADEINQMLHHIVSKYKFIYHDYMSVTWKGETISGRTYVTDSMDYIFSLDLLHILKSDVDSPRKCPRCNQLFFSNNYKARYCPDCKECSKKIRAENRKNNPCRYLHKQITDLLNNYRDGSEAFREESNYYWAIIQGKEPKTIPINFDSSITTEKDYYDWLIKQKELAKIH